MAPGVWGQRSLFFDMSGDSDQFLSDHHGLLRIQAMAVGTECLVFEMFSEPAWEIQHAWHDSWE